MLYSVSYRFDGCCVNCPATAFAIVFMCYLILVSCKTKLSCKTHIIILCSSLFHPVRMVSRAELKYATGTELGNRLFGKSESEIV